MIKTLRSLARFAGPFLTANKKRSAIPEQCNNVVMNGKEDDGVREFTQAEKLIRLVECIQLIAADSSIQQSVLPDGVCKADEIALTFDNWYQFLPELVANSYVSAAAECEVKRIDEMFDAIDDLPKDVWLDEALEKRSEWAMLREQAMVALNALKEEKRRPHIDWVSFVV